MLASTGKPLAQGCRQTGRSGEAYIAANRDLLGLTQSGAAALEILAVAPMGGGAAVLFRQRFGGLHAGVDACLRSASATAPRTTSARRWPAAPRHRLTQRLVPRQPGRSRSRIPVAPTPRS